MLQILLTFPSLWVNLAVEFLCKTLRGNGYPPWLMTDLLISTSLPAQVV